MCKFIIVCICLRTLLILSVTNVYTNSAAAQQIFSEQYSQLQKRDNILEKPAFGLKITSDTFQQVDTPDSVLQSGLGLGPGPDTALRSMVDPRDYDRLRFFQMSAAQPNTFEETIHRVSIQHIFLLHLWVTELF